MMLPKIITENTLVPISLVGVFVGGMLWFGSVSAQVNTNTRDIATTQAKQDGYGTDLNNLRNDMIEMKTELRLFHEEYRRRTPR